MRSCEALNELRIDQTPAHSVPRCSTRPSTKRAVVVDMVAVVREVKNASTCASI